MNKETSNISVIICTKNRSDDLSTCLKKISETYSILPYKEIIVVDSSSDNSERCTNQKEVERINGKYFYEYRKGLSFARNTGIMKSSGEIIVFADDDFIVDKNWIKNLVENYDDPSVVCCTGNMLSYREDDISKIFEDSIPFGKGDKKRMFTKENTYLANLLKGITSIGDKRLHDKTPVPWAVGAGFCSFRRNIFDRVGYFDLNLGVGTKARGSEDTDMFYRILKGGYKIIYEPKSIIYHNHRQSINDVFGAAYNNGWGGGVLIRKYYKKDLYMLGCNFGYFFLLSFSLIKSSLLKNMHMKKMIAMELKGFLKIR